MKRDDRFQYQTCIRNKISKNGYMKGHLHELNNEEKEGNIHKILLKCSVQIILGIGIDTYFIKREEIPEMIRSEEHTSELQSRFDLVCRLLLEKKKIIQK